MNLRELEYLVALADQRNFRRAAEICGVSQPTLSTQLRKLEEELGATLIERAPRNVILTAAGQEALARARRILDEVAQMRDEAARHSPHGSTRLRLGVFPTLGPYLLPHLVPRLVAEFPEVELLLSEEKSEVLIRRLVDGQIDAALLALPVQDPHLTGRNLFKEPFLLAVPPGHKLAGQAQVGAEALSDQSLMLLEEGHCLRDQALDVCRLSGAVERSGFQGTSLETLRQMVVAGVGITLLPALAAGSGQASGQNPVLVSFSDPTICRHIGIFWRRTTSMTRMMEAFAQLISAVACERLSETLGDRAR
ncbi:LysR substrate-binding domain-containing protein [Paracoccus sp. (in: a-proteobacteria)]|uniref:LysR substrate-binding domain-containing protein n=1 Tax=Paracoccus sp. TaxID=267 RepID=UPI0028A293D4|nr:LysR substrate-binding domain-containing protein [Paracoccus sp. (in: a-proteobacteria)]